METETQIYSVEDFKKWFDQLDDQTDLSFGNTNSGCGCLLTQFFRSKGIKFYNVGLSCALNKDGYIVARIGNVDEDEKTISRIIIKFMELKSLIPLGFGDMSGGTIKKHMVKGIF